MEFDIVKACTMKKDQGYYYKNDTHISRGWSRRKTSNNIQLKEICMSIFVLNGTRLLDNHCFVLIIIM